MIGQQDLRALAIAVGHISKVPGAPTTFGGRSTTALLQTIHGTLGAPPGRLIVEALRASVPLGPRAREIPRIDGSIYLQRFDLAPDATDEMGHVYLQHLVTPDADEELHDHPWDFTSYILLGGYLEQVRLRGGKVGVREHRAGTLVHKTATKFHRIAELYGDTWTLVFTGPKKKSWDFWHPRTGKVTPWRKKKGGLPWREIAA